MKNGCKIDAMRDEIDAGDIPKTKEKGRSIGSTRLLGMKLGPHIKERSLIKLDIHENRAKYLRPLCIPLTVASEGKNLIQVKIDQNLSSVNNVLRKIK